MRRRDNRGCRKACAFTVAGVIALETEVASFIEAKIVVKVGFVEVIARTRDDYFLEVLIASGEFFFRFTVRHASPLAHLPQLSHAPLGGR